MGFLLVENYYKNVPLTLFFTILSDNSNLTRQQQRDRLAFTRSSATNFIYFMPSKRSKLKMFARRGRK